MEMETQIPTFKSSTMKKSDLMAFQFLIPWILSLSALVITTTETGVNYWLGQMIGSLFFIQSFILIHECGHFSFFKTRSLNYGLGFLVGFISQIPFTNWQMIHELHHRWTGFRDKDPTTEGTITPPSARATLIANFCWRFSIPLFALGYRFGIYWNLGKLKRHLDPADYQLCLVNIIFHTSSYLLLFLLIPKILMLMLPAWVIGLMVTELIILSQHSHIRMPLAEGNQVKPMRTYDQVQYTRSLDFPTWISRWVLLNVNLHEAHHQAPTLPCYFLDQYRIENKHLTPAFTWYIRAKNLPAKDYIFSTKADCEF
jgi:acyl-lipid omega-6 desaturase (Delta-12 desaturase)